MNGLFVFVALLLHEAFASLSSLYHIPYACSLIHEPTNELVGSCAIFQLDKVLVSVDNFREVDPVTKKSTYLELLNQIEVHAGSNYMNPKIVEPKRPPFAQTRKPLHLYVVNTFLGNHTIWMTSAGTLTPEEGVEFDALNGLAYNVGILVLNYPFNRSPYVQPIAMDENIERLLKRQQRYLESHLVIPTRTCITYSWNYDQNSIRYHEVMHLKKTNCVDVYCKYRVAICSLFPSKDYHVCFKSTKFADVCPKARGAALYCNFRHKSVFAILTNAVDCRVQKIPCVYTTLSSVIEFFRSIFGEAYYNTYRVSYDVFGLDQLDYDSP